MITRVTKAVIGILIFAGAVTLGGCPSNEPTGVELTAEPTASNRVPTISGTPASAVKIGDTYSFTPSASDPDGDPLAFIVQNKPGWATFETATGELSGSPTLGDIGVYDDVSISVSDGQASSSLNAYSITVTQVAMGTATLSWTPPTQNEDGSPLADLAGYKIYYGTESGNYPTAIRIDNPSMTTLVVENLTPDTYFIVMTALNEQNFESAFSNETMKVVQ